MSISAVSTFQKVEPVIIGSKKAVSVKHALKCVSNKNSVSKIWHQILCFFSGKGLVTKQRLVKALHETDLPTLAKVQRLFTKAKELADKATISNDANEKAVADKFLKRAKNHQLFLDLLAEEFLVKFAANDPAILTFVKGLPATNKKAIQDLAQAGITSTYLVAQSPTNPQNSPVEVLKPLLEKEMFAEQIKAKIDSFMKPKANAIPHLKKLYNQLNKGLLGVIQNCCGPTKTRSKDLIKPVTFKKVEQQADKPTEETYFVAPKPTRPEETAAIFKKALAEKSSHIVALSYPDYLVMKADIDHKLGNSSITLKLLDQKFIEDDYIRKRFQVTDASLKENGKPLQRNIDVLVFPEAPSMDRFNASTTNVFVKADKDMSAEQVETYPNNPLIIGFDGLAFTGTYLTMRNLQPNADGELPFIETYHQVAKSLGAASLPRTAEEVVSLVATFKETTASQELASVESFKTKVTEEEFAKAVLVALNPGTEPTDLQIKSAMKELTKLHVDGEKAQLQSVFQNVCTLYKEKVDLGDLDETILEKTIKAYGIKTPGPFPELHKEVIHAYKEVRFEKAAALAKEIFKGFTEDMLKVQAESLARTIHINSLLEKFKDPKFHQGVKELLAQKTSLMDLLVMTSQFTDYNFYQGLSEEFRKQKDNNTFRGVGFANECDPLKVLEYPEAFKEYLTALKAAKAAQMKTQKS
ncbi:MAG: hypothetical protein CK425_02805 [Parachlamydia sp.]|nr:MAG: hypothetical protein CK425_02805 [Parachlamydia sp.]